MSEGSGRGRRPDGGSPERHPRVSLAIPVYNEEEVIPELIERVVRVIDQLPGDGHEVVLVDDGSRDRSRELLARAAAEDPRIVVVELSRNFGHQAALTAALDEVRGDVVLVMDGDLQDPPEALPTLLEKHREGYDVVYVQRVGRKEPWPLRLSYFVYYRLARRLSEVSVPLDSGDFALLDRGVVDAMREVPERNRYLRGLRSWVGFRQCGVEVERAARAGGRSKYSLWRLMGLAFDGIFAFSVVPLRAATMAGALAIVAAGGYGAYALIAKLVSDISPRGFTALILALVFLSGVQLVFLGVVGEYIGRIYREVKRRPHYVVRRRRRVGDG